MSEDLLDTSLSVASDLLYELSGRQFSGSCLATVRPCARRSGDSGFTQASYWWGNWAWNSGWGFCSCNRPRSCGCSRLSEITLGGYPLTSIVEVKVDGAVLDAARYRIDDFRYFVRLPDVDGTSASWPRCQRLELATTEEDTFEVTYTYGILPPAAGASAAAELACQLALACSGSPDCRLPSRVTEITRQGVTMVLNDPGMFLDKGRLGLPMVDTFLLAYNRHQLRSRAASIPPGAHRAVRRAGT